MNKKAQFTSILYLVLFFLVFIGGALFIALGTGVTTFVGDTINEASAGLGMVDDSNSDSANLTFIQEVSVGTVNKSVQMFKWLSGILLIFGLLGLIIFASVIRLNPNGFMIGIYLLLVMILIISAIFISNIYEEFYNGTDDIALELKSMPITSFLLLYMPHLITMLAFIGGIIIFTGIGEELS